MNNKIITGLFIGIIAGIIDVIPMIIQNLTWDANFSAFSLWVVVGILLSITEIKIKGFLKGLLLSFLVATPVLIIIGAKEPYTLIPIFITTSILGSLSGLMYEKFTK